jgi:flavin reductase (DIM6/NTAB) family NADH-FMN oxidoreductase RutF
MDREHRRQPDRARSVTYLDEATAPEAVRTLGVMAPDGDRPSDELLNKVTWKIPNALALVGSRAGDERNAMTTSWITQLSMEPVLIGIGVDNSAVTHRLITEGGSFTVNLWDADDTRVFVRYSKPAEYTDDDGPKLNGRPVRDAATGAPVFDEAIAWVDCEVRQSHDLGTHTLFIGEVVDAAVNDDDARPASMNDTRMKYGGVKRGGH